MNKLNRQNDPGFTLIELAVVLVIIGIVAGMGMGLLGSMTKRVKFSETRETVKMVFNAIIGYAVANKRLPANLTVLGVKTTDSYSRSLFYDVANGITAFDLCTTRGNPYLSVTDISLPAKTNIAFLILSEGENQCPETGASPYTIIDTGVTGSCAGDGTLGYDDIVMYMDIDTLRKQACNPFKIVTDSLPLGTEAVAYTATTIQTTDGTTPFSWSSTLPLPLVLDAVSGQITGTPTSEGAFSFTVTVTDLEGRTATKSFTITVDPNDPQINTDVLHYSTVGTLYSATIAANGGTGTYTWTIAGVPWLSVIGAGATATISGTPATAGTYALTVQITDGGGRTDSRALSIAIN